MYVIIIKLISLDSLTTDFENLNTNVFSTFEGFVRADLTNSDNPGRKYSQLSMLLFYFP